MSVSSDKHEKQQLLEHETKTKKQRCCYFLTVTIANRLQIPQSLTNYKASSSIAIRSAKNKGGLRNVVTEGEYLEGVAGREDRE